MKEILSAITLVILIHLIIFYQFNKTIINNNNLSHKIKTETKNKSNIKYVTLKKKKVIESKKAKKIIKKKPSKKIVKKTFKKKKKFYKKVKKKINKSKKKNILKKVKKSKNIIPDYNKLNKSRIQEKTLEDFLSNPINTYQETKDLAQEYKKLYGNEYNEFTLVQKAYLKKNLETVQSITQKYLRYPDIAIKTKQQGLSIIEFYLHPNGDISNLKLKKSSGYTSLDKESIDVIKTAYKEYPKPKEKTKMIFYIRFIYY
ncbi:MAG: energy transducer TonB [Campylobacteraceae bacterium]|nr:energy transducer TonB [Campylobacteraceae bacterium]